MGHPAFDDADFLAAALALAAEHGPASVTVAAISARLRAPTGSFYHRFESRDALLARLVVTKARPATRDAIVSACRGVPPAERPALAARLILASPEYQME